MITGPILLPSKPAFKADSFSMLDWGGPLTPQNGGAVQMLMRLGTRGSFEFTLPPMPTEPLGRLWSGTLRLAKLYGAIMPFGLDGFRPGACGVPVVDGAGQSGSTLKIRGFQRGGGVKFDQPFSLIHGGRRYVHFFATDIISLDGTLTVDIFPMLRVIPDDGDVIEITRPMIQGSLSASKWTRQLGGWSDFGTLTITEDE